MSRQIGLKDFSIAVLKTDDISGVTYDAVKKLERSVSAKITPKTDSSPQYSDDSLEEVINSFSSVDVEIELNQLSLASRAILLGKTLINGVMVENKDDVTTSPYVALIFKSKKSNGAYRYVCLYKGKFELAEEDYETTADKIKAQTAKLKGTFMPRQFDGNWRLIGDSDATGAVVADLDKWFTTVPTVPVAA
ncbi:major tail protein [Inconstantimicrobium mannanitabidum]|uniref:Uncharacterized protein n=1 Tax=Inconstantimicrobium mannanitabidum TaxID=1604901 RepID=A0ACB5R8X4_9CLOT|nr:major tail protein [Clostridium sp. TW13]GKX65648.1 hypothetical protein rsdtw13_09060 [Clostridium sp. TW13]